MAISMLKIRRPLGRLIFNMGIAISGKTVFLIETAPWKAMVNLPARRCLSSIYVQIMPWKAMETDKNDGKLVIGRDCGLSSFGAKLLSDPILVNC